MSYKDIENDFLNKVQKYCFEQLSSILYLSKYNIDDFTMTMDNTNLCCYSSNSNEINNSVGIYLNTSEFQIICSVDDNFNLEAIDFHGSICLEYFNKCVLFYNCHRLYYKDNVDLTELIIKLNQMKQSDINIFKKYLLIYLDLFDNSTLEHSVLSEILKIEIFN